MFGFIKRLLGPPVNFRQMVADGALIVDVRTKEEFNEGHIKGSVNIPLNTLKQEIPQLKKKNKTIVTVCRSGTRSGVGKNMLKLAGMEVFNGGAWNQLERKIG
jgi:rhodanese-related sulfurtransferase